MGKQERANLNLEKPWCAVEGCANRITCKEFCQLHYDRKYHQDHLERRNRMRIAANERLKRKLADDPEKAKEHAERQRIYQQNYRARNLERVRANARKYAVSKNAKERRRSRSLSERYKILVNKARRTGIPTDISLEMFSQYIRMPCHYCSQPTRIETGICLDRKIPSKGYIMANVVTACTPCNRAKNHYFTELEMLAIIKILKQMRGTDAVWDAVTESYPGKSNARY